MGGGTGKGKTMAVYLDVVIILNFFVDFLLLVGTTRLASLPCRPGRAALAAVLGGLYGGICLVPGFRFLGNYFWRLVALAAMAGIAFGFRKGAVRPGVLFILLSMALGGAALGLRSSGGWKIVLAAAVLAVLCRIGFRGNVPNGQLLPVHLWHGGNEVTATALQDTGNTLRDPLTGEQVLVAGPDVAGKLVGLTQQELSAPVETLAARRIPGLRLIPYRAVGQPGAMLLAVRCERVKAGDWDGSCIVAFAPDRLGTGNNYQLLIGGAL